MAPRGTRRPHAKRVRSKPMKTWMTPSPGRHKGGGGGGKKTSGCGLFLFALMILPTLAVVVIR